MPGASSAQKSPSHGGRQSARLAVIWEAMPWEWSMDLFGLEQSHPTVACFLYALLWAGISVAFLWPFSGKRLLDRSPICLTVVTGLFLVEAITILPLAMPHLFEYLLGHSLSTITTTIEPGGTFLSEPWLERWQEAVAGGFIWVAYASALWATVNLCRCRSWITNTAAVLFVVFVWIVGHAFVM